MMKFTKAYPLLGILLLICFTAFCGQEQPASAAPLLSPEAPQSANISAVNPTKTNDNQLFASSGLNPTVVPVLSQEEADAENAKAIKRFKRETSIKKIKRDFKNNNRIHLFISLIPLLLIVDILCFWKKRTNKKPYFSLSRRIYILFSVALFTFGLFVFVPWSIYFGNTSQFSFIFQDFVNLNLDYLSIVILAAFALLLIIPPSVGDYIVAAIAGLGLSVYVQSMFMNVYLGSMNGVEPEWNQHAVWAILNAVIWLIVISIPVLSKIFFKSQHYAIVSCAMGAVLLLEITAAVSMVLSAEESVWKRTSSYYTDTSNQFQFSKDKNILVFVFDTLGSGYIEECFKQDPQAKDIVKDFTWYIDARSNYNYTFPGYHHELTGTLVSPANDKRDLFEHSWHSPSATSFYGQLAAAGFDARAYSRYGEFGPPEIVSEYFSNIKSKNITSIVNNKKLRRCLLKMSCFSSAPYCLKRFFFYSDDFDNNVVQQYAGNLSTLDRWLPNSNDQYYQKLCSSKITADSKKPVFLVQYTRGPHRPWQIDEKCVLHETPFDTPYPTIKSCFFILDELISRMKAAKVYDNTAILVCSDHGGNHKTLSTPFDMSFMVKPFNENKDELTIDDSKVLSLDILPTLLKMAIGDKADLSAFSGYPVTDIPAGRKRICYKTANIKDFPPFYLTSERKGFYSVNCLEEYEYIDADTTNFIRYIPLDKNVQIDESILTTLQQ